MNTIAAIIGVFIFSIILRCAWISFKYMYIVNSKFGPYMEQNHADEWAEMNKDYAWLPWKKYDTMIVLHFIRISGETFGDNNINVYRKKLNSLEMEFMLLLISIAILVLAVSFLVVRVGHPE